MSLRNSGAAYGSVAKLFHWLTFLLLIASFALGFSMVELKEELAAQDQGVTPQLLKWYSFHKWIGVTVFLLAILRLGWRLMSPPPAMLPGPAWQLRAAHAVHWAIYALLIAIPLLGWLTSSALGFKTVYLGVLPLPDLIAKDKAFGEELAEVHELFGFALLILFALHVVGALKHHLVDRDNTLRRMLPFSTLK